MAKKRPPESKTKPNPLGAIARKPSSYVGDLDSLLAEVGEGTGPASGSPSEKQWAERESEGREQSGDDAQTKPRMKRINLDVPSELHQRFKGVTGMAGRTMTDVLQELIRDYLDRASRG